MPWNIRRASGVRQTAAAVAMCAGRFRASVTEPSRARTVQSAFRFAITSSQRSAMDRHIVVAAFVVASIAAAANARADELFQARLSGNNEVPAVATDTTGHVEVLVSKDRTSAEYMLRVENGVRVTQSHFHCGPAGVNGPIIVFLAGFHAPGWDVDGKWVDNTTVTDANIVESGVRYDARGDFRAGARRQRLRQCPFGRASRRRGAGSVAAGRKLAKAAATSRPEPGRSRAFRLTTGAEPPRAASAGSAF